MSRDLSPLRTNPIFTGSWTFQTGWYSAVARRKARREGEKRARVGSDMAGGTDSDWDEFIAARSKSRLGLIRPSAPGGTRYSLSREKERCGLRASSSTESHRETEGKRAEESICLTRALSNITPILRCQTALCETYYVKRWTKGMEPLILLSEHQAVKQLHGVDSQPSISTTKAITELSIMWFVPVANVELHRVNKIVHPKLRHCGLWCHIASQTPIVTITLLQNEKSKNFLMKNN